MANTRTFTFLGTGTSVGVPMVGCDCEVCRSDNPRNQRFRCAVLIGTDQGNILIDTPPELRLQLLRENVQRVQAVLFTHYHADHLFGLDDVRPLCRYLGGPMPLYCTGEVEDKIREAFSYAFARDAELLPAGYIPKLTFRQITEKPFTLLGERQTTFSLGAYDRCCTRASMSLDSGSVMWLIAQMLIGFRTKAGPCCRTFASWSSMRCARSLIPAT